MVDVMNLRKDQDYQTKANILAQLQKEGMIDQLRAQLRSQVIQKLEQEKKKQFGSGASKYLQQSELSNPITKRVIQNDDGLLCAEIIREFLNFYKMNYTLQVYIPEMSLTSSFQKSKQEIEREIGLSEQGDHTKPLLLKIIEQVKYGVQSENVITVKKIPTENTNPNLWTSNFDSQQEEKQSQVKSSVVSETKEKKEEKKKKTGGKKKKGDKKKSSEKKEDKKEEKISSLTKLDDLPTLGVVKKQVKVDTFDFDDFNDLSDHDKDKDDFANKYSKVSKQLRDFEEEDKKGFKVNVPTAANAKKQQQDIDWNVDDIEEDIQTEQDNHKVNHLLESNGGGQFAITVSQSLGIDPSVDSLALDEFDHIERVE